MDDFVIPEGNCCLCGKYSIVNKTRRLCYYCNFKRTHKGISYKEYQLGKIKDVRHKKAERRRLNAKNMKSELLKKGVLSTDKNYCTVKGCVRRIFSWEGGGLCGEHLKLKRENEKAMEKRKRKSTIRPQTLKERKAKSELSAIKKKAKENSVICEGCGKSKRGLDYSHILSVAQRKDLELDTKNKNMLCRTCHEKWESNNAEKLSSLNCLFDNLKYIREKDEGRFWKIYFIFNDNMMFDICKKIEDIDQKFKSS